MAKVLMPLASGFEEIEALTVADVLRRADIDVTLAGLHAGPVSGAHAISVITDATIDDVDVDTFDMIVLPGGQPGADNLNADPRIRTMLGAFEARKKVIGAICAAPIVLAAAGLLRNKKVTCYPSYRDQLHGGIYVDSPVVSDGTIITSQGPGTALSFSLALVALLAGSDTSERISKAMLVRDTKVQAAG